MSWRYGTRLKQPLPRKHDQNRRLNGSDSARAWSLVQALSPRRVYVYAMNAEPWVKFISSIEYTAQSLPMIESEQLIGLCHAHDIDAQRLDLKKEIAL